MDSSKLRAACDRCHQLKNRCARSGGPDSRCDRCERLDIDCVFGTNLRMGRPRGQRSRAAKERQAARVPSSPSHSRRSLSLASSKVPEKEKDKDYETLDTPGLDGDGSTIGATPRLWEDGLSDGTQAIDLDMLLPEGSPSVPTSSHNSEWDFDFLAFPQALHNNGNYNDSSLSNAHLGWAEQGYLGCHELLSATKIPFEVQARDKKTCRGPRTGKLLELQTQLHRLMSTQVPGSHEGIHDESRNISSYSEPPMDEVLGAMNSLLEILKDDNTETLYENKTQRPEGPDHLSVLHTLTCYTYLMEIIEPIVSSLASQIEGRVNLMPALPEPVDDRRSALTLGGFSLASQPTLNAHLVLHIVFKMVQQLHGRLRSVAFAYRSPLDDGIYSSTPTSIAAQSMLRVIQEKDMLLLEKLRYVTDGRYGVTSDINSHQKSPVECRRRILYSLHI